MKRPSPPPPRRYALRFWVFFSSKLFGSNVMNDVASKSAANPLNELAKLLGARPLLPVGRGHVAASNPRPLARSRRQVCRTLLSSSCRSPSRSWCPHSCSRTNPRSCCWALGTWRFRVPWSPSASPWTARGAPRGGIAGQAAETTTRVHLRACWRTAEIRTTCQCPGGPCSVEAATSGGVSGRTRWA